MHSFDGFTAPPEILDAVHRGKIASICLFSGKNVSSPEQVRALSLSLRKAALGNQLPPPLIGIDQEGGQLIAITGGATELPGNMALGATRSPALAEQAGRLTARELLAMGINLNFAPSLDVNVNPANPVIGIRSFGDDPTLVADLGVALIRGLQGEGVLATAKHFPGHGDTATDTHYNLPVVPHSLERIEAVELAPFRAAIEAGVDAVMAAHVLFPSLDNEHAATMSARVLDGFLRAELGFQGLIITDAMDMYAVAQFGAEVSITGALGAGVDLVLMGHLPDQMGLHQRLSHLARAESLRRIQAAREKSPAELPPLDVVGCAEHRALAQEIADRSITLVRGDLPLRFTPDMSIAVITPTPADLTPADTSSAVEIQLAAAIARRHRNVQAFQLPPNASDRQVAEIVQAVEHADVVVVGTINAVQDPAQANLVQSLYRRNHAPIVVALRTPYDLTVFPMITTYLCAYGIRPVTMEAVAKVLFGEIEATGVLPCAIPGISER